MDTRGKIVGAAQFTRTVGEWRAGGVEVAIARGPLDPLLAAHVRLAREARPKQGKLALIISEPANPILESRARAELAASLAPVDLVTIDEPGLPAATTDWSQSHEGIARDFVAHVLERMS